MKFSRSFTLLLCTVMLTVFHVSPAAAAPVNVALGKSATAPLTSVSCTAGSGPANAVDGGTTDIYNDKWCAQSIGASYLRIDLGRPFYVSHIVVYHASSAGESAQYNTRDYSVRVSGDGLFWRTVVTVTGNTASATASQVNNGVPGQPYPYARYVELVVTQATQSPASLVKPQTTRIYEVQVMGSDCASPC